jgi:hypothetical protein
MPFVSVGNVNYDDQRFARAAARGGARLVR